MTEISSSPPLDTFQISPTTSGSFLPSIILDICYGADAASDGGESGTVSLSTDGSLVWASSAISGYNGTLYFFNRQGSLLWHRQIYSPALSIETGGNLSAFVWTNWGALLYGGDGSLLKNITTSLSSPSTGCLPIPNFWYWSGGKAPVAFIDVQGSVVSSYNPGGYTNNAVLSSDGRYALIASNDGVSQFSLAFVFLGNQNYQSCQHS